MLRRKNWKTCLRLENTLLVDRLTTDIPGI